MSRRPRPSPRRLSLLAGCAALVLGLGACGRQSHPTYADTEGFYVDAGAITYQVQVSRQLNQYSTEDRSYLQGVNEPAPKPDEAWFAVFIWAKNQTKQPAMTSDSFDLVDTQGIKYYPVLINSQVNQLAWTPQTLQPGETEPAPDSSASFGPTQGEELLFKIGDSAYSNRPVALEIHAKGQDKPSRISLDL
ncbi:MAG: hypothetical protein M3Z06_01140 [Actinomycetota bacterium]|nr:hypothetical protein [Actinomycetota bacterium]